MATTTKVRKPPTDTGACGSNLGYNRHRGWGQTPCRPCLTAASARREDGRQERIDRLSARRLPLVFGQHAARAVMHPFDGAGDVSQCATCWGWRDDFRHLGVQAVG